jgi:hypothetical protein
LDTSAFPADREDVPFAVIGRERDLPALKKFGVVEVIARGPSFRRDRTYALFRVRRGPADLRSAGRVQNRGIY